MNSSYDPLSDKPLIAKTLEITIHVGLVVLVLFWCFRIAQPFIQIFVWGIIIAIAISPGYRWLNSVLGGRKKLAAALVTLLLLVIIIVPCVMFATSLVETAQKLSADFSEGSLRIPAPSEKVKSWPVIGQTLYNFWHLSSENLTAAVGQIAPHLKSLGLWLLNTAAGAGFAIVSFGIAILIAGVLLANETRGIQVARAISVRLAGERGTDLVKLSGATVRSVARGILGVALIQAILAGLGCLVAGVPGAGLWALIVLILAVIQLPTFIILAPIVIYVFYTTSMVPAILFAIWNLLVGGCDSFLKPLLMGRGVDVPMLVVFIGAIGGFILNGIVGLFIGAIILSLGFKLFEVWLDEGAKEEETSGTAALAAETEEDYK
ncbi:MAG: AI-2E family transporter [Deltaproteobacteria bacterium]|jgi:predicted PurR-regulated permease PerM|nr:AI-2E family transporter [Deltaproteobacteria bacterium]